MIIADRLKGNTTLDRRRKLPHPSSRAASMISRGSSAMNVLSRSVLIGIPRASWGRMIAHKESSKPKLSIW